MADRQATERKEHRSIRLRAELMDELERHAREVGTSFNGLVERYVDEGLRTDEHPLIVFRDGTAGRRAALAGTRLDVWQVIETVRNSGNSPADAADYLGLSEAQVRACVRYYALYTTEIDEWIERMHAFAERQEAAWRREQEVLA